MVGVAQEDSQKMDTALSSANWRGVYKHNLGGKQLISATEWSEWWLKVRHDVGLDHNGDN